MNKNRTSGIAQELQFELTRLRLRFQEPKTFHDLRLQRTVDTQSGYSLKPFDDFECIFFHIPKTGGVSVSQSLFGNLAGGHLNVKHYKAVFRPREFRAYFKFTFVRNPWDRLLSAYLFLKAGGFNETDRRWALENLSAFPDFSAFVMDWLNRENVWSKLHFQPQIDFISTNGAKPEVDFIGRFENLEEDFAYVKKRIGISTSLGHFNRGPGLRKDYREYYSEAAREVVAKVYREDIAVFGYEFDGERS